MPHAHPRPLGLGPPEASPQYHHATTYISTRLTPPWDWEIG